jgi:MtrB/PioB family decaheme-associated outer membrane protein
VANYTRDERDNRTPRNTWVYIGGDSENQKPFEEGRINLPYSYQKEQLDLTATWRATRGIRLKGGADWIDYERTYSEVIDSEEQRLFVGANIRIGSKASLSFDFVDSDRDVDEYVGNRPYIAYRVPGSVDDDDYDNLPALRKYDQADRERREYRVRADFQPLAKFNLGITGASYDDDYDDPDGLFGLQSSEVTSWSLDAGFHPTDRLSVVGYYTRETYDTVQAGRMWSNKIQAENPANDWQAAVEDDVATWNLSLQFAGAEGESSRLSDRLRLGLDLTRSLVESDIRVTGASNIGVAPLPTLRTDMDSWSLWGSLDINERTSLRLSYEQQRLDTDDFAYDDVPIDGSPSVLLMGQSAAHYDLSLVMLYLAYRY